MFMEIFAILLLISPTAYAVWEDRKGDKHPNKDLVLISVIVVLMALLTALINPRISFIIDSLRGASFAAGFFILFFAPAINIVLYKNGIISNRKWWNHLSLTAWPDSESWWSQTPWYGRLLFTGVAFYSGFVIYFCPCKLVDYTCKCIF